MSNTSLQLILAFVSYGKLMALLAVFGLQAIGTISYITALVTLLSIVSQLYNNQGVQVSYIRSKPRLARMYKEAMNHISLYTGIIALCTFLLIDFLGLIIIPLEYVAIIGAAVIAATKNGAYEFQCTVNNRVDTYLYSQIYGSLVFLCVALLIYCFEINIKHLIALYPMQVFASFIYYKVAFKEQSSHNHYTSRKRSIKAYIALQKKNLTLNAIPVTAVTCDYIIKNLFITTSGPVLVGLFQIIQSIDSLIGNIFAGPIYKKAIYDYTHNHFLSIDSRFIFYIKRLALPIFLISAPLALVKTFDISDYYIYAKRLELVNDYIWILILFLISKYFTLVWGLIGQILLSGSRSNAVVCGEIGFKIMSTLLSILFFVYVTDDIYAYIYSYSISSILLLYYSMVQLDNYKKSIY